MQLIYEANSVRRLPDAASRSFSLSGSAHEFGHISVSNVAKCLSLFGAWSVSIDEYSCVQIAFFSTDV
jgi:hypothetical protein